MLELMLFCALLAAFELDTTYMGQFMLSRPLIVGGVFGYLTGNLFLGLQIGVFTELIYLDFNPIGGVVPPSGAISAGAAVLMAHFFGLPAYFAFFAGIICGILFSFVEKRIRIMRAHVLRRAEAALIDGALSPAALMAQSLLFQFLAVFGFLLIMFTLAGPLAAYGAFAAPEKMRIAFQFSYFVVPWMGLAMMFISFSTKPKTD